MPKKGEREMIIIWRNISQCAHLFCLNLESKKKNLFDINIKLNVRRLDLTNVCDIDWDYSQSWLQFSWKGHKNSKKYPTCFDATDLKQLFIL